MCARPPETLRTLADGDTAQQSDGATWVPDMLIQCVGSLGKPVWLCDMSFLWKSESLQTVRSVHHKATPVLIRTRPPQVTLIPQQENFATPTLQGQLWYFTAHIQGVSLLNPDLRAELKMVPRGERDRCEKREKAKNSYRFREQDERRRTATQENSRGSFCSRNLGGFWKSLSYDRLGIEFSIHSVISRFGARQRFGSLLPPPLLPAS
ncbi:hypothetical protein ACFX2C_020787 [Malus domestica]